MDASLPEVLTVRQAAEWLQVSRHTLLRLIRLGSLPASRIGSVLRIRRVDLELLLLRQRVPAPGTSGDLLEVELPEEDYRSLPVWRLADLVPEDESSGREDGAEEHDHYLYGVPRRAA